PGPIFALLVGRGLSDDPDATRLGRGGGDAELAQQTGGKPLIAADLGPGVTAVGGLAEAGVLAAADKRMRKALHLPDGGVEHLGMRWVHRQVHGARPIALKEHLLPGRAAVAGAEHAALDVPSPGVA